MANKKHDVELSEPEYEAILNNLMISSMFEDELRNPKKCGEFVTLRMSEITLDSFTGFVAAEANHAKTRAEEETLGSACESLEVALMRIKKRVR